MRTLIALSFSLLVCGISANALDEKKLVDMTYPFSAETHHWPTAKPFHLDKISEGRTPDGYWYSSYNYGGSEHVGTHLDARFIAVGIDTPSMDHGPSRDFIAHQILGAANVPIFENVAALEKLPAKDATIFVLPVKIKGGSGAPLRIFALLP